MGPIAIRPQASGDDGYSRADTSAFATDGANGFIGELSGVGPGAYIDWFSRYTNVQIPAGATITDAYVVFKASSSDTADTVCTKFGFCAADSPAAPTSFGEHAALTRTTMVDWDFTTNWVNDTLYSTTGLIDLTSALQEVIDRPGWALGNALILLIDDDGSSADAERWFDSYDGDPTAAPQLNVTFTEAVTGGTTTFITCF